MPDPRAPSPLWRVVKLLAGIAMFLYGMRVLAPLPIARVPFILLAALLAAGAMAITDSLCGIVAAVLEKILKGPRQ